MGTELSRTYDPAAVEMEASRVWMEEKCFAADPRRPGEPYCIVIPPPNVTGALHLGHAINSTLQDILIRVHRMRGFNTLWIPGIDHAGIATQAVVEKQLKEKENKTRHDVGREDLVRRIWEWKEQYGNRIVEQLKRLGCSCDWDRTRFTLDDMCARAVRETFFKLFKDGLVYRGKRLVNWDTHLQTSISDDEIYHETVKTSLWHLRYPIIEEGNLTTEVTESAENTKSDKSNPSPSVSSVPSVVKSSASRPKYLTIATTRPETLLGDTAVAVHSQDPRWNWAIGKFVALPLTGRKIPIIADDILVDPAFGSGVVKVTPAHDPNDYAVWQRHQGQADEIGIINILNANGTINENGGAYAGMKREAARKKVVADLTALGLLEKEEPYETQVGHSDRSKTPIEPYLSDQWFVKMAPLAEPALEVVRNGTIKFFPERHAQQYLSWLGEKRDWPISRQLWWGHRIPVWNLYLHAEGGSAIILQLKSYFREIGLESDVDIKVAADDQHILICTRSPKANRAMEAMNRYYQLTGTPRIDPSQYADVVTSENAWELARKIMDGPAADPVTQDPDVLDTWFSSALWPHSTLGWPEQTADLAKWYPTSVLVTGRDIITLWVARMVMAGLYNMGLKREDEKREEDPPSPHVSRLHVSSQSARELGIPFHHVAINPTILDGKGERMSKSKGNGVDPVDIIDTHGADALRFTMTLMATETQDARLPVKKDGQGRNTSDKFDIGRNLANKLWNAARFALAALDQLARDKNIEREKTYDRIEHAIACGLGKHFNTEDNSEFTVKLDRTTGAITAQHRGMELPLSVVGRIGAQVLKEEMIHLNTPSPGGTPPTKSTPLLDRWILSRFNRAVTEANTALAEYRFDQYAKICYDFFWRDYCDWYVEAIKPALKDPARSAQAATVLAALFDVTLRLLHPIIPFITETIWWKLNESRATRGLPGLLDCPPSNRLIHAAWPAPAPVDEEAETTFAKLQEIIAAIRNARNEYNADKKTPSPVSIQTASESAAQILANRETIELLANCQLREVRPDLPPIPNAAKASAGGCDIFIEGLADPDAERQRAEKRREELARTRSALRGRLDNAGYIAKAPPHLVEQTKSQLAEVEAELAKLG